MRNRSPLKQYSPLIAVILVVGIIVAIYGLNRDGESAAIPEPAAQEQMASARQLLDQNQPEKALQILDEWKTQAKKGQIGEEAELLRLKAMASAGMSSKVAPAAAQFLAEFPESTSKTEVELMKLSGEVASAGLANPALLQSVETFIDQHPDHAGVGNLLLALGRHEIALGDRLAARRRLGRALEMPALNSEVRAQIQHELGNLNLQALLRGDTGSEIVYTVESGDSIWQIAQDKDVTPETLMKINNITNPTMLRIGQSLRVPQTDFSIVCDIGENTLTLFNNGEFLKVYPVRTGRAVGTTPTGDFRILNKKEYPTWRPGDGRVYLPGDPNNELGTRWMSFESDILGIHGTIHPETVGEYASNGCIGMTREDVEELFDLIQVGTSLKIVGAQDLTRHKVIPSPDIPDPLTQNEIAQLGH